MKKERFGIVEITSSGTRVIEVGTGADITEFFRDIMINKAALNLEALKYDTLTGRAKRIPMSQVPAESTTSSSVVTTELDPVMQLIANASNIKPADLEMSDIKWKYLVRSAVRGKNILTVGPAGCGKTQAAKALALVPIVKEIEVTEEEYQMLLKDTNVISVTKL